MANDWTEVRYNLDASENFREITNSPWYSDAVYDKFSPGEYQRRHELARGKMARDGLDALILTGSPNIYSMGGGVTWASGLIDERGLGQYMILPRAGEPMLIYPHAGCHIEVARQMVGIDDVRGSQGGSSEECWRIASRNWDWKPGGLVSRRPIGPGLSTSA